MDKSRKFYRTLNQKTGKRSVITNLSIKVCKNTIKSSIFIEVAFNKTIVDFSATVKGTSTQKYTECFKNNNKKDDKLFAYPTNMNGVFLR